MNNCKYCKIEISNGIEHETCLNEDLNELNNSGDKNIPCMSIGKQCGNFAGIDNRQKEVQK